MTQPSPSPSAPIPDRYEPAAVEERWYPEWEERGYFRIAPDSPKTPYCIVIPPPNVTGSLHMGHAFTFTLQDVLIRMKRMDGFDTLWQPGTDHAGIATQVVVERQLADEGKTKDDLGREAFVARVWKWKEESGGTIIRQLKRLGASCDWSRLALHDGRGPVAGGARGVRAPVRRGADLPRRLHRQLVPALPDGAVGPRGRARGA